jgi:adenine/guanine phosphoribosyltransferase-like PRPP-binding protein
MQTYTVDIAGELVTLPIVPINQKLAISLLMVIDMGVRFGERIGQALADHLRPFKPDIIVGAATLGIPVVIEVSRALGLDQYVIAQKSPKIHLADALVQELESVTSAGRQRLMLDRRSVPLLAGRRVAVVDDVVATGSSLAATIALARAAGAQIVGAGVILTEGHDWKNKLGADASLIHELGHIPQFALADGKATPMPETL